jgi:hypothetical protein
VNLGHIAMGAANSSLTLQSAADKLLTQHIAPSDNAFWSELLAIPNSTEFVEIYQSHKQICHKKNAQNINQ